MRKFDLACYTQHYSFFAPLLNLMDSSFIKELRTIYISPSVARLKDNELLPISVMENIRKIAFLANSEERRCLQKELLKSSKDIFSMKSINNKHEVLQIDNVVTNMISTFLPRKDMFHASLVSK